MRSLYSSEYWRGLAASTSFPGFTLEKCLATIHSNITESWNFNDPNHLLISEPFLTKAKALSHVVIPDDPEVKSWLCARNVLALIGSASTIVSDDGEPSLAEGETSSSVQDDARAEGETTAELELKRHTPGPPAIKVSLGLRKNVYQVNGEVGVGTETRDDLNAAAIWGYFGCPVEEAEEAGMWR
ncbi:hypothetical protein C8F04DRAFT_1283618 [Mycena alexandri]|uniref:Uncharacterized protein n=1 Tax=Mycena alexandri TaxID=1745969 RepID=A0AAD6WPB9_9AGAR|nr:hypothetical protein C8F04DRAFT_1283618 [Mycena alexandri]